FLVHQDGFGDDTYMYVDDVAVLTACATPTPGGTATNTPTNTPPPTNTATRISSPVPPTATYTPCPIQFSDVGTGDPFYTYIRCLACRGIISGYSTSPPCAVAPCFLPGNPVTRGQVSKMISNAAGLNDVIPTSRQTFTDVPYGHPFWVYVERLVSRNDISGYNTSPPCPAYQTPCF